MNISKSIRLATIQRDMTIQDYANLMGVSRNRLYKIAKQERIETKTLLKMSSVLDLKTSEFIALGE